MTRVPAEIATAADEVARHVMAASSSEAREALFELLELCLPPERQWQVRTFRTRGVKIRVRIPE